MSYGFFGKILEVNLSDRSCKETKLDPEILRDVIGGCGLGAALLLGRYKPGRNWDHPDNPLMFIAGPFSGLPVPGSGLVNVVSQGALHNFAAVSQANGYFGAYLRSNGYDAMIVTGKSEEWNYLVLENGVISFCSADPIMGMDTYDTDAALKEACGNNKKKVSVMCIGPAGENLVKFSVISADCGHMAAHSGLGAVMGEKKLKAVVAVRGEKAVEVAHPNKLKEKTKQMFDYAKNFNGGMRKRYGTGGNFTHIHELGQLPVRNLATSTWNYVQNIDGKTLHKSSRYKFSPKPCWACGMHGRWMEIAEGPHAGFKGEEPEYELMAACSSMIDNRSSDLMFILSTTIDRLGLDGNESGWIMGWCMECFEKGWITSEMLAGIDLSWGNVDGAISLLKLITNREKFGDILARGVKQSAEHLGGDAYKAAVFTKKGNTPRGHDHRARWDEYLDTNMSCTGTIENTGGFLKYEKLGLISPADRFDPKEVGRAIGQISGWRQFEDSLGMCRFIIEEHDLMMDCLNAITDWNMDVRQAIKAGKKSTIRLRIFNLLNGLTPEMDYPSPRYSSSPANGPIGGMEIAGNYEIMRATYLKQIGWDVESAKPLPETLRENDLAEWIPVLWPKNEQ